MHDVVVVGIPLLAILAGILFNRSDIKDLRAEMNARFNQIEGNVNDRFNRIEDRLAGIEADIRQFYHLTGKLEGRIDALEKRA
jgi:hypothetical protein